MSESARRAAFATAGRQHRDLTPGAELSFGRHEDCDLRVGADDEWVSRHVGVIAMDAEGRVSVQLTSSRHVLRVVTPSQSERILEPRPAGAAQEELPLVWEHATLVVPGEGNASHRVFVVTGARPVGDARSPMQGAPGGRTVTAASRLNDEEQLLLAALAEPILRFGQVAEPASYAAIADRLSGRLSGRTATPLTARMVRRYLDELFDRLTLVELVPGLEPDERVDADEEIELVTSRVRRLAIWAVGYDVIGFDDLNLLP